MNILLALVQKIRLPVPAGHYSVSLSSLLFMLLVQQTALAQESTITYQGQLRSAGTPFTGQADLQFRLFDQLIGGSQVGPTQTRTDWPVEDGLFQVELDFGGPAFDGSDRFLEVQVDGNPLNPRQKITVTPYALQAAGVAAGSIDGNAVLTSLRSEIAMLRELIAPQIAAGADR